MAKLFKGNGFPLVSRKQLPNDPCKCGSGKKAKKCHGTQNMYYYSKLTEKQKAVKEREAKKKEAARNGIVE